MNTELENGCLKNMRYRPHLMKIVDFYQTGGLDCVASEWDKSAEPEAFFDYSEFLLFGQWCLAVDAYDLFKFILSHPNAPKDCMKDGWWTDHLHKSLFAKMVIESGNQELVQFLMQWPEQTALPIFCAAVDHDDMPTALSALSVFDSITADQPDVWKSYMEFTLSNAANQKQYSLVKAMLGSWCGQCQALNCSQPNHTGRLLISEEASPSVVADALRRATYYSEGSMDETGSSWTWRNPEPSSLTPVQMDVLKSFSQHPVWARVSSSSEVQKELKDLLKRSAQNVHVPGLLLLLPHLEQPENTSALAVRAQQDILDVLMDWTWTPKHRKMLEPHFVSALDPQKLKTNRMFQKLVSESADFKAHATKSTLKNALKERRQSFVAAIMKRKI